LRLIFCALLYNLFIKFGKSGGGPAGQRLFNHIKTYRHKLQLSHDTCANDNGQIASVRFNI